MADNTGCAADNSGCKVVGVSNVDVAVMPRKVRMEWLDAMRGFTMILVVAYHVAQFGFSESEKISSSLPFLVLFRMPLFFFVSGFLAYKARWTWTMDNYSSLVWKKVKVQVLPALVFLCVFIVLRGKLPFFEGLAKCMHSPTKGGYWFTWVLLHMFVFYYTVAGLSQHVSKRAEHVAVVVLWVMSLVAYQLLYMPNTVGKWYANDFMMCSSLFETMKFMHFFVFGNLVHRAWEHAQRLFDTRWFFSVIAVIAFVCCAEIFKWHITRGQWVNLPRTFAMYTLMLMVVMVFRHYQDHFSKQKRVGQALQYIGTRTLDVYLLHFIFLPSLPQVGRWLNVNHPNFVVEIVLAVGMGLVVIAFCLLVSNILRVSPLFKEYLFGKK